MLPCMVALPAGPQQVPGCTRASRSGLRVPPVSHRCTGTACGDGAPPTDRRGDTQGPFRVLAWHACAMYVAAGAVTARRRGVGQTAAGSPGSFGRPPGLNGAGARVREGSAKQSSRRRRRRRLLRAFVRCCWQAHHLPGAPGLRTYERSDGREFGMSAFSLISL